MRTLVWCEARKIMRSRALYLMLAASVAFTTLTALSPADTGGQMFMMAGDPFRIGGAIGFIGNVVDPERIGASAIRTSFLFTPFWLPVVIVFTVHMLSADFLSKSMAVSKAKGVGLGKTVFVKITMIFASVGLCYSASCAASFAIKANEYGTVLSPADFRLLFEALGANVLLLCALSCQTALLFLLLRRQLPSVLGSLFYTAYVLVGYPASYGLSGEGAFGSLIFAASPAYHLINVSSLSFEAIPLLWGVAYGTAAIVIALGCAVAAANVREV